MKKIFVLTVITALLIGCSKDEEGETSTPTATPQELILGEWNCISWTQEGSEIMQYVEYYKMHFFLESSIQTFEFEYRTDTDGTKWRGTYEFEENETRVKTIFENQWIWNGSSWQEATPDGDKSWEIEILTSESLKLNYIITAQGVDYHFVMLFSKG